MKPCSPLLESYFAMPEVVAIATSDWPRCAVCQMPVENFYAIVSPDRRGIALVAQCHRRTEVVEIPDEVWDDFNISEMTVTEAFSSSPSMRDESDEDVAPLTLTP